MDRYNYDYGKDRYHHHRSREYYGEDRIKKRHEILEKGVPSVWGESPRRDRDRSKSRDRERSSRHEHKDSGRRSSSSKKSKRHKETRRHKKHKGGHKKRRKSRRRSSSSSSSSFSSASSSSKSSTLKPSSKVSPAESRLSSNEPRIEAHIVRVEKKKPPSYIELINKREEEEFVNQLRLKQEQTKKEDAGTSQVGESSSHLDSKEFGKALLPGEGAKMAAFVAGGKRIPRRGEIGITSDEIEKFEQQGYVMSGSRHRRMEAVRLRKESQIYSADDRRALAIFDREKSAKRKEKLQLYFSQIVEAKQQSNASNPSRDS